MHKYLITGGSGFIGTNLINELNEVFDKIVILNIDIKKPQIAEHNKRIKYMYEFKKGYYHINTICIQRH